MLSAYLAAIELKVRAALALFGLSRDGTRQLGPFPFSLVFAASSVCKEYTYRTLTIVGCESKETPVILAFFLHTLGERPQ